MVASLENTVRKWKAVRSALQRAQGYSSALGVTGMGNARTVISKNAPAYNHVLRNYERSLNNYNNEPLTNQHALAYFGMLPNRREYITAAYNKLPNLHSQLDQVARKIIAVRKLQKIRRSSVQARNKKEKNTKMLNAFLTVRNMPRNMANREILRRIYGNLHASKTPYGPKTFNNYLRRETREKKYPNY
jgi:hypothetical protein